MKERIWRDRKYASSSLLQWTIITSQDFCIYNVQSSILFCVLPSLISQNVTNMKIAVLVGTEQFPSTVQAIPCTCKKFCMWFLWFTLRNKNEITQLNCTLKRVTPNSNKTNRFLALLKWLSIETNMFHWNLLKTLLRNKKSM